MLFVKLTLWYWISIGWTWVGQTFSLILAELMWLDFFNYLAERFARICINFWFAHLFIVGDLEGETKLCLNWSPSTERESENHFPLIFYDWASNSIALDCHFVRIFFVQSVPFWGMVSFLFSPYFLAFGIPMYSSLYKPWRLAFFGLLLIIASFTDKKKSPWNARL